ncbi:MAG: hypothetical protein K6G15_00735 [Desulfovibrio sp.]|nr:hypothetical protein [Desulfovibrio sp.]
MNKTIDFKALAAELAELEKQGKGRGHDLLIARVLHNMSPARWKEFCKAYPASKWGALPLSELPLSQMADADKDNELLLGEELKKAIVAEKFTAQVERELVRLQRTGGELSLVASTLQPKPQDKNEAALWELLGNLLKKHLEPCDSMAQDLHGQFLTLLPGTGPVRSRHFCEQVQKAYTKAAKKISQNVFLCMGLVSIGQGENESAEKLVQRASQALQLALEERGHLHQIGPELLDERSTLVHSDEKRFLFFGNA